MIKHVLPWLIVGATFLAFCNSKGAEMPLAKANQIADAIYKIEGGANTKWPYGIKSIKTSNPRQVCINTIRNNYVRWQKSGSRKDYLDFLADVYCPQSADFKGNANWKANIHKMIAKVN
jgi:hypothetical protein